MKVLYFVLFISYVLYGEEVFITVGSKNEMSRKYIRYDFDKNRENHDMKIKKDCYYQNGIISQESCYRQTGNIFISFKEKDINIEEFAQYHNLKVLKLVNPLYKTILFKVESKQEIIEVVNNINKKYKNIYARVEWITPRNIR